MTEKEYLELKKILNNIPDESSEKENIMSQIVEHNKALIEEFPFLLPRNRWNDEIDEDYDYSYTELDQLPGGWRIVFGYDICKEIKDELVKYDFLNDYRIMQIKEKFGSLRWYDGGIPRDSNIYNIISKYERLSCKICINCGKPADYMTSGWISYYCEDCVNRSKNPKYFVKRSSINE